VLLRSQGLGILCGQATVLLLAIGSIVIAATRDGASAELRMDEVRPFFEQPALAHLWFYALVWVVALFALNTALCTWHGTMRKWRAGQRSLFHHGPALMHVAFLVALLAHAIGGFGAREEQPRVLTSEWRALGDGRRARLLDLRPELFENGQLKQVHARVEVEAAADDGAKPAVTVQTVAYNRPLSTGWGARLWLLANQGTGWVAEIAAGGQSCALAPGQGCKLAGWRVHLDALYPSGHWGSQPAVRLLATRGAQQREQFFLLPGGKHPLIDGTEVRLVRVGQQPEIVLRVRRSPGTPWALVSALLLLAGTFFLGRRWWS